ncbi:hypothetical protein BDR26DRAFT_855733 [Obelidium mucronatum]|nr:hypothetical protein BDR26DRAFT_855733 [Obelidium mucronatum]
MKDFLGQALRACYDRIGFSCDNEAQGMPLYSDMCSASNSLLLFSAPSHFALSIGKSISPKLKSVYSIGIPNVRSAGFLYTSSDLCLGSSADEAANLFAREVIAPNKPVLDSVQVVEDGVKAQSQEYDYHTLMYGRLFEDYHLEALVSQKLGEKNMLVLSGISDWESDNNSHLEAQYVHKNKDWCADVTYSSTDNVFGTSCHVRVPFTNWSAGGEVIYTASEKSGGISLGAKWVKVHERGVASILTFLCNPMMGYMNTTYTSTIRQNWVLSTSYDFNTYSYNSDLAVGIAYSPIDAENRLLKCRFSMTRGLALLLEGQFKRAIIGLGVSTNLGLGSTIRQSIGFEVQFL